MLREADLAAEADEHISGDIGMGREPREHALERLVVLAVERDGAASFMSDREDAVDVRKLLAPGAVAKSIGDVARRARRAVHCADHGHVIPGSDPAIRPQVAGKRPRRTLRHRRLLGREGVVAVEQVGLDVVNVHPRPGRNRFRGKPDDLAVLAHRLPLGDVGQRDLVPERDRLADLDLATADAEDEPPGDRPGGDRHVIVAPEQDRPLFVGRRRHCG